MEDKRMNELQVIDEREILENSLECMEILKIYCF